MKPEANCETTDPLELPSMDRGEKPLMSPKISSRLRPWFAALSCVAAVAALIIVPLFHSTERRVCSLAETAIEAIDPQAMPATDNADRLNAAADSLERAFEKSRGSVQTESTGLALAAAYLRLHRKVDARKLLEVVLEADSLSPQHRLVIERVVAELR